MNANNVSEIEIVSPSAIQVTGPLVDDIRGLELAEPATTSPGETAWQRHAANSIFSHIDGGKDSSHI